MNNDNKNAQDFFAIYCQNVSGARSKIYKMNELLTKSTYHAILLQETWFDDDIMY